jgi:hypothetical protein
MGEEEKGSADGLFMEWSTFAFVDLPQFLGSFYREYI